MLVSSGTVPRTPHCQPSTLFSPEVFPKVLWDQLLEKCLQMLMQMQKKGSPRALVGVLMSVSMDGLV